MAVVGSILKVKGRSNDTPDRDPIPGIAPTRSPIIAPTSADVRFGRLRAVSNPLNSKRIFSIVNLISVYNLNYLTFNTKLNVLS